MRIVGTYRCTHESIDAYRSPQGPKGAQRGLKEPTGAYRSPYYPSKTNRRLRIYFIYVSKKFHCPFQDICGVDLKYN